MLWSEVVMSEDMLGGNKRSATNPVVLNWRQRDYLARSLTELMLLVEPTLIQKHLWPVLKMLLEDPINEVREDVLWAIPILLKTFCSDTLSGWSGLRDKSKKYGNEMCSEVISWLQDSILGLGSSVKVANFNDRQLYCQICAAVGLALRFGEGDVVSEAKDPVSVLSDKFKSFFFAEKRSEATENGPYQRLSAAEIKHLKNLLSDELLPPALDMKEDRISNVRITLMKALQLMPSDIRNSSSVKSVLKDLEDEMETWTSFGAEEPSLVEQQHQFQKQSTDAGRGRSDGPVDVDDVVPDDGAQDSSGEIGGGGGASSGSEEERKAKVSNLSPRPKTEEPKDVDNASDGEESTASSKKPPLIKKYNKEDLKKVTFEDGSIGMQLEPTADDSGCRVCGFSDGPDGSPSPAKTSGKIAVGDVIVKVNSTRVRSYDATIEVLKAGGRRKITFRPGVSEDTQYNKNVDAGGDSDDSEDKQDRKQRHRLHQPSPTKKEKLREKEDDGTEGESDKDKKLKKPKKEKKEKKEKKREK